MITDFRDIKDERDRELYVQCRQVLDYWFEASIKHHEDNEDHNISKCVSERIEIARKEFLSYYNGIKDDKMRDEFTDEWKLHHYHEMFDNLFALVVLRQKVKN